jgi:hypothetical protein|tara:strand:+ start:186 stop:416 length:231 start_codon:yes stop_codon:yes gene_type:complete
MFKKILHWLGIKKSNNETILELIRERLRHGAIEHGEEVPLDGTRDHLQDAIEEALDMIVYLAAMLIELQNKTKRRQ